MNYLDIAIIVLIGWGLMRGFFRGIISEVAALLGVGVGFWAAEKWYPAVAADLSTWVTNPQSAWVRHPEYVEATSFFVVFFSVFMAVNVLGWAIKTLTKVAHLGTLDRLLGAAFGGLKGVLISAVLILGLTFFLPRGNAKIVKESRTAPQVSRVTDEVVRFVPNEWKISFREKIETIRAQWERQR